MGHLCRNCLVYTAYVVATILPIIFPQCPYRTPLCDLVYVSLVSFCRIVPQVSRGVIQYFLSLLRRREFSSVLRFLPPYTSKKFTVADNDRVQVRATDVNKLGA